jgi:hypothetical protein
MMEKSFEIKNIKVRLFCSNKPKFLNKKELKRNCLHFLRLQERMQSSSLCVVFTILNANLK